VHSPIREYSGIDAGEGPSNPTIFHPLPLSHMKYGLLGFNQAHVSIKVNPLPQQTHTEAIHTIVIHDDLPTVRLTTPELYYLGEATLIVHPSSKFMELHSLCWLSIDESVLADGRYIPPADSAITIETLYITSLFSEVNPS
jgi:hypothetical protein